MKVVTMIQAHMGSSRLPGKVMKEINGRPVLYHVFERCTKANLAGEVIIITSHNPENVIIEDFCKQHGISCFRGAEDDVLDRYYQCNKKYNADIIVRVTSDCPLLEPKLIDFAVTKTIEDNLEFFDWDRPVYLGSGIDVFSFGALENMKNKATLKRQKEHVIGYFLDNPDEFISKKYLVPEELQYVYNSYRLTLDTPEDFEFTSEIYRKFYIDNDIVKLEKVVGYLDEESKKSGWKSNDCMQKDYFSE